MSRFDYVKYDATATEAHSAIKAQVEKLEELVNQIGAGTCAQNASARAKALAITKLEEFNMWVGKAFRDDQIARGGSSTHEPSRSES